MSTKTDNNHSEELPSVLTVVELAAYLRIGRHAAYDLVRFGVINHVRIGRLVRIPRAAVLAYLNGGDPNEPNGQGRAA